MPLIRTCTVWLPPLALAFLAAARIGAAPDPVGAVNVFTGTSNSRWMLFPGATLPFGLVKLSPDNQTNVWNGGYEYTVHFVIRTDKPLASLDAWQRDPYIGNTTNYGTDWRAPVHYRRGLHTFTGHDACGVVLNFHTAAGSPRRPSTAVTRP
jgi:hypothetical protein